MYRQELQESSERCCVVRRSISPSSSFNRIQRFTRALERVIDPRGRPSTHSAVANSQSAIAARSGRRGPTARSASRTLSACRMSSAWCNLGYESRYSRLTIMIGPSFLGRCSCTKLPRRPDGRAVLQLSVGSGVRRTDRCAGQQKRGPDRPQLIESNDLPVCQVGVPPRGNTARPAARRCKLGVRFSAVQRVLINVADSFLSGSEDRKTRPQRTHLLVRQDAAKQHIRGFPKWQ